VEEFVSSTKDQAASWSEGLRAEYAALAGFLGVANAFCFTVLGLLLTAAALAFTRPSVVTAALILSVSLFLWFAELRTRSLLSFVLKRGSEIESNWKKASPSEEQFMTTVDNEWDATGRSAVGGLKRSRIWVFLWNSRFPIFRHGVVIDFIFLAVFITAAVQLGLVLSHP
jgi:hypothetical protein